MKPREDSPRLRFQPGGPGLPEAGPEQSRRSGACDYPKASIWQRGPPPGSGLMGQPPARAHPPGPGGPGRAEAGTQHTGRPRCPQNTFMEREDLWWAWLFSPHLTGFQRGGRDPPPLKILRTSSCCLRGPPVGRGLGPEVLALLLLWSHLGWGDRGDSLLPPLPDGQWPHNSGAPPPSSF